MGRERINHNVLFNKSSLNRPMYYRSNFGHPHNNIIVCGVV